MRPKKVEIYQTEIFWKRPQVRQIADLIIEKRTRQKYITSISDGLTHVWTTKDMME